ncbi:hypothetical protein [Desulfohalovibrio reitneri]|uniref:hypothetical protein n=1 Tax=Desulfohalovibrio reitneri TaxID=1307759 RepID=UPI0004A6B317|nr:hypothetical protein [Desulfohalovibrio reitneri]
MRTEMNTAPPLHRAVPRCCGRGLLPQNGPPVFDAPLDHIKELGCYGALVSMTGHVFQNGDKVMLDGLRDSSGEKHELECEVVRVDRNRLWVAFEESLPDDLEPGRHIRITRVCPGCRLS